MSKRKSVKVPKAEGFIVGWLIEATPEFAMTMLQMVQKSCAGAKCYRIKSDGNTIRFPEVRPKSTPRKAGKKK